jgi:hypothetical protein
MRFKMRNLGRAAFFGIGLLALLGTPAMARYYHHPSRYAHYRIAYPYYGGFYGATGSFSGSSGTIPDGTNGGP